MTEHSLWRFSRAFHRAINERQPADLEALLDEDVDWAIYGPIDLSNAISTTMTFYIRGQSEGTPANPIDFVFIDGDHSYDACRADIEAWTPFVKPGGVIAFHDFGSRADGVTRAIFEAIKAGKFSEIVGQANTIIAFRM